MHNKWSPCAASVVVLVFSSACGAEAPTDESTGIVKSQLVTTTLNDAYRANAQLSGYEQPDCSAAALKDILLVEPDGPGPYPVMVYAGGTSEPFDNVIIRGILTEAARQGFVAASIEYQNETIPRFCSDPTPFVPANGWYKARCAYSTSFNPESAIAAICARPKAGCSSHGVVAAGMSQGGYIAAFARNFDARVRGAWTMGIVDRTWDGVEQHCLDAGLGLLGTNTVRLIANSRFRVIRGIADTTGFPGATPAEKTAWLNRTTGRSCLTGTTSCLNGPNASGWHYATLAEVNAELNPAAHCFMQNHPRDLFGNKVDCDNPLAPPRTLDPVFARIPPATPRFPLGLVSKHRLVEKQRPSPRSATVLKASATGSRATRSGVHFFPTATSISQGPLKPRSHSNSPSASVISCHAASRPCASSDESIWCSAPNESRSNRTHSAALANASGAGIVSTLTSRKPACRKRTRARRERRG